MGEQAVVHMLHRTESQEKVLALYYLDHVMTHS